MPPEHTPEMRLDAYVRETTGEFSLETVCTAVGLDPTKDGREVRSILMDESLAFAIPGETEMFRSRQEFFRGKSFRITRFDIETAQKVLIPGGRAAPFCHPAVLPSEMKLVTKDGKPLPRKKIKISIEEAAAYYNLLGSEEMFHYFEADHPDNTAVLMAGDPEGQITLEVFSTAPLGHPQAVRLTVTNWMDGEFTVEAVEAADLAKAPDWLKPYEKSLCRVFENVGYFPEIPEQLMLALWGAPEVLEAQDLFETDRLLATSELIEITLVGSRTLLWRNDEDLPADANASALPEGISASSGTVESPEQILDELKCPISTTEITAEMFDECYRGGSTFSNVYTRLFGHWELPFADDAQEAYFQNFLEAQWEDVCDDYDRVRDDLPGKVRHFALAVNHERLRWLAGLDRAGVAPNAAQAEVLAQYAELFSPLIRLLELLNHHEVFADETEPDRLIESITHLADTAAALTERYERAAGNDNGHHHDCGCGHGDCDEHRH